MGDAMDVEALGPEFRLSAQELLVCRRLVEAYPDHVAPDRILDRVMYAEHGGPGEPVPMPATEVCRIRAVLGRDAVESVWATRVNRRGQVVKARNRPMLGYRAGPRLLEVVGLTTSPQESPRSSEVDAGDAGGSAKGSPARTSLRPWQAPEPHRHDQARIATQLEAACREAIAL